jgi:hypothetical protein
MVKRNRLAVAAELTKFRLTGFITLSALFGFILAAPAPDIDLLVTGAGVWLLAAGAAVLNHIQDRHYDRWFARTRHRSLPRNRIPVRAAGWAAAGLVASGLILLAVGLDTHLPWVLGVLSAEEENPVCRMARRGLRHAAPGHRMDGRAPGSVPGHRIPAAGTDAGAGPLAGVPFSDPCCGPAGS